jgi:hypothetical protein
VSTTITTSYQGTPDVLSSIRVQIRDATSGSVLQSRTNTGVRQDVAASGFYVWSGSLTDATGYASLWDEGGASFLAPGSGEVIMPPGSSSGGTTVLAATAPASISPLTFTIKRGDTDPSIIVQALYPDPSNPSSMIPWPIPGGSAAKFTMRDSADFAARTRTSFAGAAKVHATASIDDAANGIMSYGWAAGDTDTDGLFRGEFEVTSGAETRTFPVGVDDSRNWIAITIVDDLDPGVDP